MQGESYGSDNYISCDKDEAMTKAAAKADNKSVSKWIAGIIKKEKDIVISIP